MEQNLEQMKEAVFVTRDGFQAVGLRWDGTFAGAAAGEIRTLHSELKRRLHEIPGVRQPGELLALSYHVKENSDGFTHYAVVEVTGEAEAVIPEGMVSVTVPTMTYAKCEHRKGQSIEQSYRSLYTWIHEQGYKECLEDLTHFEICAMEHDSFDSDPEFTIMIPVERES
ncbi:GyrI-like domain-containing protein [Paenibacillus turpanensis]|uniref:GyrI-like domain-containing protein n=1 Tax=Paenibacillus turpanensis TaxID=2689078 RepID=UPI001FB5890F|nr:GyrI-like domain-containing protein [Paenibacillus turpanensis]